MMGVEEYYKKENGKVYRYWRFAGNKQWYKKLTGLKEVPYQKYEEKEI